MVITSTDLAERRRGAAGEHAGCGAGGRRRGSGRCASRTADGAQSRPRLLAAALAAAPVALAARAGAGKKAATRSAKAWR